MLIIVNTGLMKYTSIANAPFLSRLEYKYEERIDAIKNKVTGDIEHTTDDIQCFPFYSILAALDRHVDLFSLDVEGADMDVLASIPFDKIDVDVFVIETGPHEKCKHKVKQIERMMSPYGYELMFFPDYVEDVIMSRL